MTSQSIPGAPRGRGRPAIGPEIKVSFPVDLLEEIELEAERRGITRAEEIRRRCLALARLAGTEHRSTTQDV